jgi:hypothetical protein
MDFEALHADKEAMENLAEEYIFGRLGGVTLTIYERHLLTCETCRRAVENGEYFIRLLRGAARKNREDH